MNGRVATEAARSFCVTLKLSGPEDFEESHVAAVRSVPPTDARALFSIRHSSEPVVHSHGRTN
jgi:hypothetical protein